MHAVVATMRLRHNPSPQPLLVKCSRLRNASVLARGHLLSLHLMTNVGAISTTKNMAAILHPTRILGASAVSYTKSGTQATKPNAQRLHDPDHDRPLLCIGNTYFIGPRYIQRTGARLAERQQPPCHKRGDIASCSG